MKSKRTFRWFIWMHRRNEETNNTQMKHLDKTSKLTIWMHLPDVKTSRARSIRKRRVGHERNLVISSCLECSFNSWLATRSGPRIKPVKQELEAPRFINILGAYFAAKFLWSSSSMYIFFLLLARVWGTPLAKFFFRI